MFMRITAMAFIQRVLSALLLLRVSVYCLSSCPNATNVACTGAVKHPICISPNQICDYHRDCPGGEDESDCLAYKRCDFEKDMCDWMTSKKTLYEWKRYYNRTSGKYCLNVDSTHAFGKIGIAKLRFKYLIQGIANSTCSIRFAYRNIGKMDLLLEAANRTESIWSANSLRGNWYQAFVQLPQNRTFQLSFEASIADGITSVTQFELGNVSFSRYCKFTNHTYDYSRNDSSIFVCHSGEPVQKDTLCDFKVDCFDGSDEFNCSHVPGRCDFESSLCNWEIGTIAPEQPRRWKGRAPIYFVGPSNDHTNKSRSGYYVFLGGIVGQQASFAYLTTKTMQRPLGNKCTFRWFYHMRCTANLGLGRLNIIYKDLETQSERLLWQIRGDQGDVWHFGNVTFNFTSFLYKIIIKFEYRGYYTGHIAIDDVSFAPECLQTQDFEPVTITKSKKCPSVKVAMNGTSASIYQFGSGREFCDVTIRTDPKLRINLFAEFFNTDSSNKVIIGAGRNGSVIYGGNFSGSLRPFSLISSTNIMTIRVPPLEGIGSHAFAFNITSTDLPAHSASSTSSSSGFKLIYVIRDCKGSISKFTYYLSGTIKPRSGVTKYYNNEHCIFKFITYGYRIAFEFEVFDTEYKSDYVQFLNNGIIGQNRFSGYRYPFKFTSKRSHFEMLFVTDSRVTRSGFELYIKTTLNNAMPATPSDPKPTYRGGSFLSETCSYQTQPAQYTAGDSLFGEITFDRTKGNANLLVPSYCAWKGNGTAGSKYFIEFRYVDTGSLNNVLRVNYEGGKSKEVRGLVSVKNLGLVQTSSQFNITIKMNSTNSSNIRMVYSTSPGCYSNSLRSYYLHIGVVDSGCYCKGFKYGFLDSYGGCQCGNNPPAFYGLFMQHPNLCTYCFFYCTYGRLYVNENSGGSHHDKNAKTTDSHKGLSSVTVMLITIPIVWLLVVVVFGGWSFYQRRQSSPRSEAVSTMTDHTRSQGNTGRYARFVDEPAAEGIQR